MKRLTFPATALLSLVLLTSGAAAPIPGNPGVPAAEWDAMGLVYEFAIPTNSPGWNGVPVAYAADNTAAFPTGSFTRVAYCLELVRADTTSDWVYASFDAAGFTNDSTKLGVPNTASGEYYNFQNTAISNMNVYSNVGSIVQGAGIATGNVEFWPSNYGGGNDYGVPGANGGVFDFGDGGSNTGAGHGSMQIHNYGAAQTLFAYNAWGAARTSELGIGNQPSGNPDWTFNEANIGTYASRTLRILALLPSDLTWDGTANDWGTAHWIGAPPTFPDAVTNGIVNGGTVTVEANHAVSGLTMAGGEIAIGAGNALAVSSLDVTGGALSLGAGATLSAGGGSTAAPITVAGDAALSTAGDVYASHLIATGPGTITKQGAGALRFDQAHGLNSLPAGTTVQVDDGELRMHAASNPLGSAALALNGGQFTVQGEVTQVPDEFRWTFYNTTDASLLTQIDDGALNGANGGLFALTPDNSASWPGQINQGDLGSDYATLWSGNFHAPETGTYTFTVHGDDYEVLWLDKNQNSDFETSAGELVTVNVPPEGWNTQKTGTIDLDAGESYAFAAASKEGGGGAYIWADIQTPTVPRERINPSDATQTGWWTRDDYAAVDMTGTDITVAADSSLRAISDHGAAFGNLILQDGATLTTTADADMTFASIAVAGPAGRTAGLNTLNNVAADVYGDGGVATTLVKQGAGALALGDDTPGGGVAGNTTFRVEGGILRMTEPSAAAIALAGGELDIRPANAIPAGEAAHYSFDQTSGSTVFNSGALAGKDGLLQSGAGLTTGGGGMIGEAMTVADNSNQRLELLSSVDINDEWTVAAWFNDLHPNDTWRTLCRGFGADHPVIVQDGGQDNLGTYVGGFRDGGSDLLAGDGWHHIAAVGAGSTTTFFVDGAQVGVSDRKTTADIGWIGNHESGQPFAADLDEFFIYNRALDLGEVNSLYNAGLAGAYAAPLGMSTTPVTVEAASTLRISGPPSAAFGPLTLQAGALTIAGTAGNVSFTAGAIAPAATRVGVNALADIAVTGPLDGGGAAATFAKAGLGTLTLAQGAVNSAGVAFQVDGGRLVSGGPMAAASIALAAGTNMDTGVHDVTLAAGGSLQAATLTVAGTQPFALGGDGLMAGPERLVLSGGTVTFRKDSMPTGVQLWLDAGALGLSHGDPVTNWADQSGHGRDFDNIAGDPSFVAASPTAGNQPVVNFDGSDWMWGDHNFDSLTEHTILAVSRYTGGDNERVVTSRNHNWLFGHHGNRDARWYAEGWIAGGGSSNTNWGLYAGTITDDADPRASFWQNGVQLANNSAGSNNTNYRPGILQLGAWGGGGGETSQAEVAEVLIFDHVLSAAELNNIGGYLATKYAFGGTGYTGSIGVQPIDQPNTAVTAAASSTLFADTLATATFGDLIVPGGSALTLAGAPLGFTFDSIAGAGSVDGSLTVRSGIAPGDSVGAFLLTGDMAVGDGVRYEWEFGPTESDIVEVNGALTFDGAWILQLIDAGGWAYPSDKLYLFANPGIGDIGSYTIDFSRVPQWMFLTNPGDVTLSVDGAGVFVTGLNTTPEPATLTLLALGLAAVVRRRRRA